ncbi:MAG: hypothetical protein DYH17_06340 [Xanthomonadales bacterium PRO6]|nr:hypothetical protein [Xanthomonadales bacterium]MCE7930975.1 hypothetical protein [Xanthomonadales bacterium PRO6]
MGDYLKAAFTWRWNLLGLFAGTTFAVLAPATGAVLSLVAAAELLYLTGLVSFPKFRRSVDAKLLGRSPEWEQREEDPQTLLTRMLNELGPGPANRFKDLRDRCLRLRRIARGVAAGAPEAPQADQLRGGGLDQLLWVFLRLLYAQQGLWKFLEQTDRNALEAQSMDLEKRLAALGADSDERIKRSLTDAIATTTMRLDNLKSAETNNQFIDLELERIEAKILALSEMSVNNQNPDFISTQVDSVADTMAHAENAIRDLNLLSGLSSDIDKAPRLLVE